MTGPVTREQHFANLNAYRDDPAYSLDVTPEQREDFFDGLIGKSWQIDAETYEDAEDALPPIAWTPSSFIFREALSGDIHSRYFRKGDGFFHEYVAYPPRKTANELHAIAQKADEAFQAALEEVFGKEAGDARYLAARQPPAVRQLGEAYVRAAERWNQAVARERRRQARGLEP